LHTLPNFRIRLGFDLFGLQTLARSAIPVLALRAGRVFGWRPRVSMVARVALEMAELGAWRVSRIPIRELVLLRGIPRAVRATRMVAPFARLDMHSELLLALAAVPPHTLPGLPMNEVLATGLRGLLQDHRLVRSIPIGNNVRVLGALFE